MTTGQRQEQIARLHARGLSIEDISVKLQCSYGVVRKIVDGAIRDKPPEAPPRAAEESASAAKADPGPAPALTPRERRVLKMIERAAEAGEPCPSNAEMMATLGFRQQAVEKALSQLRQKGLIASHGSQSRRVIEILATGQRTAPAHNPLAGRDQEILELRRSGILPAIIARRLQVEYNVVAGVLWRNRVGALEPARAKGVATLRANQAKLASPVRFKAPPPKIYAPSRTCLFIEEEGPGFSADPFCGKAVEREGVSYCHEHAERCFDRKATKRSKVKQATFKDDGTLFRQRRAV